MAFLLSSKNIYNSTQENFEKFHSLLPVISSTMFPHLRKNYNLPTDPPEAIKVPSIYILRLVPVPTAAMWCQALFPKLVVSVVVILPPPAVQSKMVFVLVKPNSITSFWPNKLYLFPMSALLNFTQPSKVKAFLLDNKKLFPRSI